jgi:hypothetical protein
MFLLGKGESRRSAVSVSMNDPGGIELADG